MELPQGPTYKAHHEYIAQKYDELTLAVNDTVIVTDKADAGWWVGVKVSTKETGWFPSNFVMAVEGETESRTCANDTEVSKVLARVEHEYTAKAPDELSLRKGGILMVLEQNDGWWKGDLNGNVGVFPANYVKVLKADEAAIEGSQDQGEQPKPFKLAAYGVKQGGIGSLFAGGIPPLKKGGTLQRKKSSLPSPPKEPETASSKGDTPPLPHRASENEHDSVVVMRVIVTFDYHAANADEINLVKGTYVDVYDTEADRGWYRGKNEDGLIGLFPANFVEEIRNTGAAKETASPKIPQAETDLALDVEKKKTGNEPETMNSTGVAHPPPLPLRPSESTENGISAPLETTNKAHFGGKKLAGAVPLMPLAAVAHHNQYAKGNTVETGREDAAPGIASSALRKPAKPSSPIPGPPSDNGPVSPLTPATHDLHPADGEVSSASMQPEVPGRPLCDNFTNSALSSGGNDSEAHDLRKTVSQDTTKRLSFVPPKPPIARKPTLQGHHDTSMARDNTRDVGETPLHQDGFAASSPNMSRPGSPVRPATPEKYHARHASPKKSSVPSSPTKSPAASSPSQPLTVPKRETDMSQQFGNDAAGFTDASKHDVDGSDVQSGNELSKVVPAESKCAPKLSHLTKDRAPGPKSRRLAESGSTKDKGPGVIEQMIEEVNNAPSPTKDGSVEAIEHSESKAQKAFYKQPTPFVLAGGIPAPLKHVTSGRSSSESEASTITQAPFSPPIPSPPGVSSPQPESHRSMLRTEKSLCMDTPQRGGDDSDVVTRRDLEQLRKEMDHKVAEERAARRKLEAEVRDLRLLMQDEFKKLRRTMAG